MNPARAASIFPFWTLEDMVHAQKKDPDIGPIVHLLQQSSEKPSWENVSHMSPESKILLVDWDRLVVHEGMLYRKWLHENGRIHWFQLALPQKYRDDVLRQLHDSATAGRAGAHRTYLKIRARFYFPKMRQFIRLWVKTCHACQRRKSPRKFAKAAMKVYRIGAPCERIALDMMGPFSETDGGNRWILVIGDYFTKYKVAVPLPNITATTIAEALITNWISYFGCPLECHTDQGSQLTGSVITEMCKLLGIEKTRTTVGRPQSDGMIENANQALCNMLNCVVHDNPFAWDLLLRMCNLAYNTNVHESLSETPAIMLFGRELTLPIDLALPMADGVREETTFENMPEYVLDLQKRMHIVHDKARENLGKASQKQEKYYNNRLKVNVFKPGSLVFYHYPVKGSNAKEENLQWHGPFVVVQAFSDRVYRIQKNQTSTPLVVNHDKLKEAYVREDVNTDWVKNYTPPNRNDQCKDKNNYMYPVFRPLRERKMPDRYGDWYVGK